jgi:hypothetical protein
LEGQTRSLMSSLLSTVLVPFGELDAASLRRAYEADPKQRLQLQLRKQARPGQKEALDHIPCYAHVRVRGELQQTAARCSVCHVMSRLHHFLFCEDSVHIMAGYRSAHHGRISKGATWGLHVLQETIDNTGKRDALEIVYMKFFAYNGCARDTSPAMLLLVCTFRWRWCPLHAQ